MYGGHAGPGSGDYTKPTETFLMYFFPFVYESFNYTPEKIWDFSRILRMALYKPKLQIKLNCFIFQ